MRLKVYDDIAAGYNELYGHEQSLKAGIILNHIKINPESRILDVGCGTGISSFLFGSRVFGIDPTFALLAQNPHLVVQGVAEYLPFKDSWFDIVISLTAVHNFFDAEQGIREMARVARDVVVISLLRKAISYEAIVHLIQVVFDIEDTIQESKDTIFLCRKKVC